MIRKFVCSGFRGLKAPSASYAAALFADRQARREYGRRGYCRAVRLDSWTENGKSHTFEAFIGRPVPRDNATRGRNVWLTVHEVAASAAVMPKAVAQ